MPAPAGALPQGKDEPIQQRAARLPAPDVFDEGSIDALLAEAHELAREGCAPLAIDVSGADPGTHGVALLCVALREIAQLAPTVVEADPRVAGIIALCEIDRLEVRVGDR